MVSKGKAAKIDQHGATDEPGATGETATAPVKALLRPRKKRQRTRLAARR
jgi:hypothetical protein